MELRNLKSVSEKHDVKYHRLRNWTLEGLVQVNDDGTIPISEDEKIEFVKHLFDQAKSKGSRITNDEVKQMLLDKFALKAKEDDQTDKRQEVIFTTAVETSFKNMGLDEIMIEFAERSKNLVTRDELQLFSESIKTVVTQTITEQVKLLEDPEKATQAEKIKNLESQNELMFDKLKETTDQLANATEQLDRIEKMLQKTDKRKWWQFFGK